jgi:WD40 repeat protein
MRASRRSSLLLALILSPAAPAFDENRAVDLQGDPLPAGALARMGSVRLRHGVLALAFAPDGKTLASAGGDHLIRIWDVSSGKELRQLRGHAYFVTSVAFSADGKSLVSASRDGTLRVWQAADGKLLHTFGSGNLDRPVVAMTFDSEGGRVLSGEPDGTVRLWDYPAGKEKRALNDHRRGATLLCLSQDARHFAVAYTSGRVALWDAVAGKEISSFLPKLNRIARVMFIPGSKALLVGSESVFGLWDPATGEELRRVEVTGRPLERLFVSPNGRYLAGRGKSPVRLWGVASGKELRSIDPTTFGFGPMAFSRDAQLLAITQGQNIHVWDLNRNRDLHEVVGHCSEVEDVRLLGDGKQLLTTGRDHTARLWDSATGKLLRTWKEKQPFRTVLPILPDGSVLVPDQTRLMRVEVSADRASARDLMAGLKEPLNCRAVSPDGKLLAGQFRDHKIRLLDLRTGTEVRSLEREPSRYYAVCFSPDGKLIASGGRDVPVIVWETASGRVVNRFDVPNRTGPPATAGGYRLAFTPDGRGLLTVDAQAVLWELATQKERWRIGWPNVNLLDAAFSSDGKLAALGSRIGAVMLVETGSGVEVGRFEGHHAAVAALYFSPDGKTLASGSDDGTAMVWDAEPAWRKATPGPVTLEPEQLTRLWKGLGSADAAQAYRAIRALAAASRQSIPLLQARLRPAENEEAERFAGLVRRLDDKAFAVREAAQKELEKWDGLPRKLLRKESEGNPSVEVRTRLKRVLEGRSEPGPEADRWQQLRAIEVLEHIGTPEARQVLAVLAERADEPALKQETQAALDRLNRRR